MHDFSADSPPPAVPMPLALRQQQLYRRRTGSGSCSDDTLSDGSMEGDVDAGNEVDNAGDRLRPQRVPRRYYTAYMSSGGGSESGMLAEECFCTGTVDKKCYACWLAWPCRMCMLPWS